MVKTEHLRGNVFEIHAFSPRVRRVAHPFAQFVCERVGIPDADPLGFDFEF
jgi:hypothetical protein